MKIKLTCFGHLVLFQPDGHWFEVPEGSVTGDLPFLLGFSSKDAAMFFIGEQRVNADHVLLNEDLVKIFPPITGG